MGTLFSGVEVEVANGLATVRLSRPHGNAINAELLRSLRAAYAAAASDDAVGGVLLAASGKTFCPGLDLQELPGLDRPAMRSLMVAFRETLVDMFRFPKPAVAALHGHALAGGLVLALTADRRILRRGALVGLNEVRVGVPLPFEVASLLRHSVAAPHLSEIALLGRNLSDEEAVASGLVHEVLDGDRFEERCRERLAEWTSRDPASFAATKAWLRAAALSEMLRSTDEHVEAFLDRWFAPSTRERILAIAEELRFKGR